MAASRLPPFIYSYTSIVPSCTSNTPLQSWTAGNAGMTCCWHVVMCSQSDHSAVLAALSRRCSQSMLIYRINQHTDCICLHAAYCFGKYRPVQGSTGVQVGVQPRTAYSICMAGSLCLTSNMTALPDPALRHRIARWTCLACRQPAAVITAA